MSVVFSREAHADLAAIRRYIARDKPRRALTFVNELIDAAVKVGETPQAFPVISRYAHWDLRMKPYRNYLTFYRVQTDHIGIVHILHGAMDYHAVLFPEADEPE